jgi:site-specific DNA recombinase
LAKRVTTIQPTLTRFTAVPITEQHRRKVAAYARVSTDHEEQQSSYEAQLDYYTNFIRNHDGWEFVNVYADMKTPSLIQFNDLRRLAGRGG